MDRDTFRYGNQPEELLPSVTAELRVSIACRRSRVKGRDKMDRNVPRRMVPAFLSLAHHSKPDDSKIRATIFAMMEMTKSPSLRQVLGSDSAKTILCSSNARLRIAFARQASCKNRHYGYLVDVNARSAPRTHEVVGLRVVNRLTPFGSALRLRSTSCASPISGSSPPPGTLILTTQSAGEPASVLISAPFMNCFGHPCSFLFTISFSWFFLSSAINYFLVINGNRGIIAPVEST